MEFETLIPVIRVLYRDDHYIVVSKPSGMMVHPYEKMPNETCLMKLVKYQTKLYLYPVHRLDRPVSGIVIFGLTSEATAKIKEHWGREDFLKEYLTLCRGTIADSGEFDFELSDEKGKKQEARTLYWPLQSLGGRFTLCKVRILTGRLHQIRRHFNRALHNIVGDTIYGKGRINQEFRDQYNLHRTFLHCYHLRWFHPYRNEFIDIFDELPRDLQNVLEKFGIPSVEVTHL